MGDVVNYPVQSPVSGTIPYGTATSLLSWPSLDQTSLSFREIETRRSGVGGSDANIILSCNKERLVGLWHEKRGEQAPVDLTSNLPVMLGSWTEAFNRQWFEKITGKRVDELHLAIT